MRSVPQHRSTRLHLWESFRDLSRRVRAGFAPGMRQLHPGRATLLMNKPHDPGQRLNVIIFPDA
jgi:hypothetical protein